MAHSRASLKLDYQIILQKLMHFKNLSKNSLSTLNRQLLLSISHQSICIQKHTKNGKKITPKYECQWNLTLLRLCLIQQIRLRITSKECSLFDVKSIKKCVFQLHFIATILIILILNKYKSNTNQISAYFIKRFQSHNL